MSIWFIVITYRPDPTSLKQLLKALKGVPVVVVENTEKKNLGYAGGVNKGIRQAMQSGAEWMVVLNQDLLMTKEAARGLCERLHELPPGIAGPFAGMFDGRRWTTILKSERSLDSFRSLGMTKNVDYISGACMAIHRSVIEQVGYFYEPYFMYYEDADFSLRAKLHGFPLIRLPITGITHDEHPVWKRGSPRHEWFLARNHLVFVFRLAPWRVKLRELIRLPKTIWEHWYKRKQKT